MLYNHDLIYFLIALSQRSNNQQQTYMISLNHLSSPSTLQIDTSHSTTSPLYHPPPASSRSSRISSTSKPIRLSTYHGQRSQSKTKQFITQIQPPPSPLPSSSTLLTSLHLSLQSLISQLILKLEEKRNTLKNCSNESELKQNETTLQGIKQILGREEEPKLTINCISIPRYDGSKSYNESFSCGFSGLETMRSRGTTFPNMMNHFKVYQGIAINTPRGDGKDKTMEEEKKERSDDIGKQKQKERGFQELKRVNVGRPIPLTPDAKPRAPLLKIPTKLSENFLKPPTHKVTFSNKQDPGGK